MDFVVWLALVFVFAVALAVLERPAASSAGFWVRFDVAGDFVGFVFVLLVSEAVAVVFALERPVEARLRVDVDFPSPLAVVLA